MLNDALGNDMLESRHEKEFPRLLGGNLSLNFINSLDPRTGPHPVDFLHSYADLVEWASYAGIFEVQQAKKLVKESEVRPDEAVKAFENAIDFRETLHRIFLTLSEQAQPQDADLAELSRVYSETIRAARLVPAGAGFAWSWSATSGLSQVLGPLAHSALELLVSSPSDKLKLCKNPECGWLFLDTSKNTSRRWCSMEGCGSRIKMRRQYARKERTNLKS